MKTVFNIHQLLFYLKSPIIWVISFTCVESEVKQKTIIFRIFILENDTLIYIKKISSFWVLGKRYNEHSDFQEKFFNLKLYKRVKFGQILLQTQKKKFSYFGSIIGSEVLKT